MSVILTTKEVLNEYLKLQKGPKQKSDEWLSIRKKTIGGSEIATVLGLNSFSSVKQLIAEKVGLTKFNGNLATRWGNLFETVTRQYTEKILHMDHKIIDDISSIEGIIPRQRYSPDGLGIVTIDGIDYIILFEFKAPLNTLPTNTIPCHYLPQVKTGLLNINICNYSIFVNNCYRKCSLNDFNFTEIYDKTFHKSDLKKRKYGINKKPSACGIICFNQTIDNYNNIKNKINSYSMIDDIKSDNDYNEMDTEILIDSKDDPIDFGESDENILNRLFILREKNLVKAYYYPMLLNDNTMNTDDFTKKYKNDIIRSFDKLSKKNNKLIVGYLPWKLMISKVIKQDRDPNWLDVIKEPVENTLKIIDEILESDNIEETFNKKFKEETIFNDDLIDEIKNFDIISDDILYQE